MIIAWENIVPISTFLALAPRGVASSFDVDRDCLNYFTIPRESKTYSNADTSMLKSLFSLLVSVF